LARGRIFKGVDLSMLKKEMYNHRETEHSELDIAMSPAFFKFMKFLHLVKPENWQVRYRENKKSS